MSHKRPRKYNGAPVDESGEDSAWSGDKLLTPFGKESIHVIKLGNAGFARGSFGELSIAVQSCRKSQPSPSNESEEFMSHSLIALKTIHNAISNHGGGKGNFGGFGIAPSAPLQAQQKPKLSKEVLNELLALRLLQRHSNIIPLLAMYDGDGHGQSIVLAFPYCPIDLREVLEVRRRTFQQPLAFRFLQTISQHIFQGLSHCHKIGILHRDIKPGNLVVSAQGNIQLCDFGMAIPYLQTNEEIDENESFVAVNNDKGLCTLYYRPPEVLLGGASSHPSVDVWSAGTVLAELITGRTLWPGRNVIDQLSFVFESLGTPNETTWPWVQKLPDYGKLHFGTKLSKDWIQILPRASESYMLIDLLSRLLALNPKHRIGAKKVLDHDWFKISAKASNRELRDELVRPAELQLPPVLFPEDRALVAKLGIRIAESRKSFVSPLKSERGNYWQGQTLNPSNFGDLLTL